MPEPINLDQTQPLPPPPPAVFARYRLKTELGRGGMGVVWRAEDTKLRRDVALKFLPDLVVRDREAMADLAAETRRCLELTHPNIVRVHDLVEEGARAAISMEFVDGPSLAERKLGQPDRCFTVELLAPWIAQLCSALDYAHTKVRIVHRDLKPLNLLVNTDGDLKVVDFGIARSLLLSGTRLSLDVRSTSVSLGYVGPQQLLGEPAAVADDIYSLGATIYELLTSKPPFYEGDIITQLREVVPPTMTARRAALGANARDAIPPEWEATVAACLAKKAGDRPRTAGEVAARLGFPLSGNTRFIDTPSLNSTARATDVTRPPFAAASLPTKKSRATLIAGGTVAVAGIILAAIFWPRGPSEENRSALTAAVRPGKPATPGPTPQPEPPPAPAPEFVVTVNPPDAGARVWLGKESNREVPDDGRLPFTAIPDGEHDLTVQASGYQPYTNRVRVTGGRGTAEVTLVPVFGAVQVVARPGTLVSAVDGRGREKTLGTVPASGTLRVDNVLTVGTYLLEFEHQDCAVAQQANTVVAAGRVARVAPVQTALPGELHVFSVPDGAEVSINGAKVGVTPATVPNQASEQPLAVEVFLGGYRREKRTVTLTPKQTQTLSVGALTLESGAIEFRAGAAELRLPRATVRVDGHEVPLKNGRVDGLEVGPRVVEILHPDYEPWKQTVAVPDRQPVRVPVKLVPKPGELTLAVSGPAAYTLTANGKPVAVKTNRATLPAAEELALEIAAKGFKTARHTLTLPIHGKQTLALALEKIAIPETGQPWTVPELGLTLLPVAAGTFAMGSDTGDPTERPLTQVTMTKPFWLGKTEVSQREWTALMGGNPSRFKGEDLPVENVSWTEAMDFCRKLTERERAADRLPPGYIYTLPTEAQWEYACRAGQTGEVATDIIDAAWHEQNSGATTHAVGTRKANAWGFHDMQGNAWEWCADWYADKLKGGSVSDPKGPAAGTNRVRRGGSFVIKPAFFRFTLRGKSEPDYRMFNIGFRLALAPGA